MVLFLHPFSRHKRESFWYQIFLRLGVFCVFVCASCLTNIEKKGKLKQIRDIIIAYFCRPLQTGQTFFISYCIVVSLRNETRKNGIWMMLAYFLWYGSSFLLFIDHFTFFDKFFCLFRS